VQVNLEPRRHLKSNEQVQEVWTGRTFSVAALMLANGLKYKAYRTARDAYHVVYRIRGYWSRTPEAYEIEGHFRASMCAPSGDLGWR
jgi:non-lysosomal glucosylceramidase